LISVKTEGKIIVLVN
jgi:hypothetical protein